MIKQCIDSYYIFGAQVRYLVDARAGLPIKGENYVISNIDRFLNNLSILELVVTNRAATDLKTYKRELTDSPNDNLDKDEAKKLSEIMLNLRLTLDAEIQGIHAYTTTPKRLNLEKLLSDVGTLFAPDVFDSFPDIARYDFVEAGKCTAFELSTAAAFHILRATEANLRFYYKSMIRQKRISSEMWGPIIKDLRVRTKTKKFTTLNNHLDNIRLSFRNPTQHPEAIYDIHEVQDLFSVCIDANNRMFKILNKNG